MSKQISNIVFTKNRPLKLEAYLRSLYTYFSKELFVSEYREIFSRYQIRFLWPILDRITWLVDSDAAKLL